MRKVFIFGNGLGMAVSPNEQEVAFVVRGEVFVASVKHGTTRRITNTPEQELRMNGIVSSIAFNPKDVHLVAGGTQAGSVALWDVLLTDNVMDVVGPMAACAQSLSPVVKDEL